MGHFKTSHFTRPTWKYLAISGAICLFLSANEAINAQGLPATLNPGSSNTVSFSGQDFRGAPVSLDDFKDSKCVVLAFLGTECPLAKLYSGRLEELSKQFDKSELTVIGINSNSQDSVSEIEAFVKGHHLTFPMLKDSANRIADQLAAERTPMVFLLDSHRRIRYQGRVDDQYIIGVIKEKPAREDLKIAVQEILADKAVSVPQTTPMGCLIGRIKSPRPDSPVTYSKQISRIFQARCEQCHREGEIAPFSLTTFEDAVGWGPMIAEVVSERRMPPWHADPHFGKFLNDASLSDEERKQIADWVEYGCPEGNPSDLPARQTWTQGWQLAREPDVVIPMGETAFEVPAHAGQKGIEYQHFWVDAGLKEDRWIDSMEIRPGNRLVVHHVIVYVVKEKGKSKGQSFLTAYVPGMRLSPYPTGAAKKIPAGSWLKFEVHYTPIGSVQSDLTSIGLNFADPQKVTHEVTTTVVGNRDFVIKPGLANQKFTANSGKLPMDVDLISLSPHMHLRGQSFQYEANYPNGEKEILLNIPHYDFNWQTRYQLAEPKRIPAGTVIRCTAEFDNSTKNPANPDPTATVRWGDQSWEEMMLGYMDIMSPIRNGLSNSSQLSSLDAIRAIAQQINPAEVIKRLDKNQDGKISQEEARGATLLDKNFRKADLNGDGFATLEELQQLLEAVR